MELLHILETAVNAVFPLVLMMLLGYVLQRIGFFTPEFIRVGSKFSFQVLMPGMLFVNVYNIDSFDVIRWDVVLYCVIVLCVIFALGFVTAVPVAFLMAWYVPVRNILEPWIQFIRNIPPLAYVPLVVIAVGVGRTPRSS